MRWRILGPVEVTGPGTALPAMRPQHRAVLAYLLLHNGQTVPIHELVEAMWAGTPPASARTQIHGCVSRLRGVLRAAGLHDCLTGRPGGYRLAARPEELDVSCFRADAAEALASASAGRPQDAAARLHDALALWRGRALTGAVGAFVPAAASMLEEQRLTAMEELNRAELALGRVGPVAQRLRGLVAEHPLRERLTAQLMLALAGSGRQAEALEIYQQTRDRLVRQLGVEPGPELVDAHLSVLRQKVPAPPVAVTTSSTTALPPAQLPADIVAFAGRAAHLRRLDELLERRDSPQAVIISAIDGMAGVGKTALAIHWGHRVRGRFDGGQLYLNLRGFDPIHPPMPAEEAIRVFLEAFAVPPARVPSGLDAQSALYRSLAARRRMLVLLDNARDAEQVRPLLPGSPGCLVIVTSRNQLTGLIVSDAAHPIALDVMSKVEAVALLARRIGPQRLEAEPEAVAQILEACAGLPLALALVAAQAVTRPGRSLRALAADLRDERDCLDPFASGDPATDIRAVFSWSYRTLKPAAARIFRLLSLHPGPEAGVPAIVSLAGQPYPQVATALAELVRARLITERSRDRYGDHDLLRIYAKELTAVHDEEGERNAAMDRLLDHYLHSAHAASALIDPHREPIPLRPAGDGVSPERFRDAQAALDWWTAEHSVLIRAVSLAAEAGFHRRCWELAWCLVIFLDKRGHWNELIGLQAVALHAAERLGDPGAQARSNLFLGRVKMRVRRMAEANAHFEAALRLSEPEGPSAQAHIHHNLSELYGRLGDQDQALSHARQGLALYRETGARAGIARILNTIGWYLAQFGQRHEALTHCEEALELSRSINDRYNEAAVLDSLGYIHSGLGNHAESVAYYELSIEGYRDVADRAGEALTLHSLGDARLAAGDPAGAAGAWRRCLEILDDLGDSTADELRAKLNDLLQSVRI